MMLALLMALTGLSALAEMPTSYPSQAEVFARGNSIKADYKIQVDAESVMGLATMFGGSAIDDNTKLILNTALSALGKLNFSMLANMKNASFNVSTKDGELFKGQLDFGAEGSPASIAMDIAPGMKINYPPAMSKSIQQSLQMNMQMQEVQQLMLPYIGIAQQQFEAAVKEGKAEAGPFEVTGVDTYDSRVTLELTQSVIKSFIVPLGDHFIKDEKMQGFLKNYTEMMAAQPQAEGMASLEVLKDPAKLAEEWEKAKKQMDEAPATGEDGQPISWGTLVLYQGAEKSYAEFALKDPSSGRQPAFITLQTTGNLKDARVKLAVIGEMGVPEADEQAKPDWADRKAKVLSGENPGDFLLMMDMKATNDPEAKQYASETAIEIHVQGMRIGILADGKAQMKDKLQQEGKLSLSMMGPTPLLTVSYRFDEVTEAPEKMAEGLKAVQMQDEEPMVSPADSELLGKAAVEQGIPALIQKLKTALPEEGEILAAILATLLNPGQTQVQPQ